MKMNPVHGKVYAAYNVIHLNAVFAREFAFYVNVWTSPRILHNASNHGYEHFLSLQS